MSLSDQIKQPGQIIGAGGGGGGATTDAGDLTTGTLAAARLPGVLANVDTQAELLSAAAAAAASHTHAASDIASGTVATARLGSGTADSTTFLRGDQTWATPSATDATKLPLAGGTMTGTLNMGSGAAGIKLTATQSAPSVGDRCLTDWSGGNNIGLQAPAAGSVNSWIQGNIKWSVSSTICTTHNPIALAGGVSISSAGASTRNIHGNGGTTDLYANVPTGGVWGVSVDGTAQSTMGTGGLQFPTAHTAPADTVYGLFRRSTPNATVVQSGDVIIDKGRLLSRTASAAIEICPVASGDEAWVRILETTIGGCIVHVNSSGTVALYSPTGGTVSASIVNSSSPAAGDYGIYLSAGVLYFKGGSSYAGKMAAFCMLGKS